MNRINTAFTAGSIFVMLSACGAMADGVKVTVEQLPEPVRTTLTAQQQGGTLGDIEKEEEDGKTVYSADITKDGKTHEVEIGTDGKLITEKTESDGEEKEEAGEHKKGESEEHEKGEKGEAEDKDAGEQTVKIETIPAEAQAAIKSVTKGAAVTTVDKETENGVTGYEADFTEGAVKKSVKVDDKGKVLEIETPVAAAALPANIVSAIKAKYPKATIKGADHVANGTEANAAYIYEVRITTGKKHSKEVKVGSDGALIPNKE